MTDEQFEIAVYFEDRDPIHLKSELSNPVLEQLCWALANREECGGKIMYLALEDSEISYIYFPISALVSIGSSCPLPPELFRGQNAIQVEDYLHLNMDRKWIEWAIENLRRGADKSSTYQALNEAGVDQDAICELLDFTPGESTAPIELPDRESIYPLAGPRTLQQDRVNSDYIELYTLKVSISFKVYNSI